MPPSPGKASKFAAEDATGESKQVDAEAGSDAAWTAAAAETAAQLDASNEGIVWAVADDNDGTVQPRAESAGIA